jgi:CubicO group peptidase (beta-lactamase class C family)
MPPITRRLAIKRILSASASALAMPFPGAHSLGRPLPKDEISPSERQQMAAVATAFMRKFDVPGLSVAIACEGRLVYENPFGESNRQSRDGLTVSNLFRIASVTKAVTSTAIFTLIESWKLRQHDRVFGHGGVLGTKFGNAPYKKWVEEITIDHLLTHTCGGWDNTSDDPMFENLGMDHTQLIAWTLDTKPLKNPPGTHYAYSNFGYCVLGRVIEQISGHPYRDFVREEILSRCGIRDMRISGNTLMQRFPEEVNYYGQNGENPYDMNVTRMDSHGGWLATPRDLVLFLNHVDGFKSTPNILKPETIKSMTTPSPMNSGYARGWAVNNAPNWWHNGSLPGTTTIMVRTASGFCWAALTNTRATGQPDIGRALDNMVWDMAHKVSAWKP